MAEHILRRELDALGFDHRITITSAGIAPYARDGALVSLDTRMALRDVGIDIGDQATSTDLKRHPEMLEQTDLIIAMTGQQARELVERFPGAAGRPVFTLRSFAGRPAISTTPSNRATGCSPHAVRRFIGSSRRSSNAFFITSVVSCKYLQKVLVHSRTTSQEALWSVPFPTGKGARGIGQRHSPKDFSVPLPHSFWGRGRGLGLCSSIYLRDTSLARDRVARDHMAMEFVNPPDAEIRAILARPATVAVVGCSDNPARDSLRIAKLLKGRGFKVIPVNPQLDADALRGALGEKCYPDLASIPEPIEIVDVFRRSEFVPEIAEDAIAKGARVLWCQLGVVNLDGARRAQQAGMTVVMDRCPAIEYARLF